MSELHDVVAEIKTAVDTVVAQFAALEAKATDPDDDTTIDADDLQGLKDSLAALKGLAPVAAPPVDVPVDEGTPAEEATETPTAEVAEDAAPA